MVRSDVSFVAFAADPIFGRSDYVLINAAWGLGEALVSGMVTPDQVIVDSNGAIHEYMIGEKAEMVLVRADSPGTQSVPVPRVLRTVPALGREQVHAIATMTRRLSDALGYPADIEGAFVGSQLMLFQARPSTTIAVAAWDRRAPPNSARQELNPHPSSQPRGPSTSQEGPFPLPGGTIITTLAPLEAQSGIRTIRGEPSAMRHDTRYARSGDIHIAYQVVGNGPLDLVFVMG
jgi:pyruvate,water dikinase